MNINYLDKVRFLYPDIQRVVYWHTQYDGTPWIDSYEGLLWENSDIKKPSKKELDAISDDVVIDSLKKSKEYKLSMLADMAKEYPPIQEQLDMLWNAMSAGEIPIAKEFYVACKQVKDKYSEPVIKE